MAATRGIATLGSGMHAVEIFVRKFETREAPDGALSRPERTVAARRGRGESNGKRMGREIGESSK